MANPTSNFGWVMPTSTDLVTDLPADFEVFGQAVDTSLADLKGGTTGQILSKNSNTNMDFTWITNDVGDITGVTAGTGITGGGTSGDVTVSFDQANFGGGQYAAGKNKIINGDFGIWQRGTSATANNVFCADRFFTTFDGTGTFTTSQQSFTLGTAPVTGYEARYFQRIALNSSGTSTLYQTATRVEDVRSFAGQTITFSFWAKANAATTVTGYIEQYFGSGGSATTGPASTTYVLTTSWQRFTYSVAMPSIAGKTIGTGSYVQFTLRSFTIGAGAYFDIWGVQLEAGSTATPFQTATGTLQGELAACQRYYWRTSATGNYSPMGQGSANGATGSYVTIPNPVTMRAITSVEYANLGLQEGGDALKAVTSVTIDQSDLAVVSLSVGASGGGLTTYRANRLLANNNSSAYLAINGEL